ncbi:hypothetical protein AB0K21_21655 [Streptosporangium sp. NPDC049248]|uniref:hypothetical protein n=1 Tax=Streptosporangium sp. NPDC049248 TaxID=3155651 RepID=UPI00343A420A
MEQFNLRRVDDAEAAVVYVMRRFGKPLKVAMAGGPSQEITSIGVHVVPCNAPEAGFDLAITDVNRISWACHGVITIGEA